MSKLGIFSLMSFKQYCKPKKNAIRLIKRATIAKPIGLTLIIPTFLKIVNTIIEITFEIAGAKIKIETKIAMIGRAVDDIFGNFSLMTSKFRNKIKLSIKTKIAVGITEIIKKIPLKQPDPHVKP
ncbi:hypothetical protein [Sulfurospirillum sp. hDNRA2]|uniref:hypothetical protein n=1 Tax=Sulfurospirillum sp. hDNRA2 TaxID=3237298 RepID=UPI0020B7E17D|nr:hypothetical protein [Sulfurospirillum sp. DNRA8]MCP3652861.1 hypothetical protein [Sulfurospirillum sp. DNRA8]MCR1811713.1 hypothetical protein [Sulfurospirillum sp. DNRA8]